MMAWIVRVNDIMAMPWGFHFHGDWAIVVQGNKIGPM